MKFKITWNTSPQNVKATIQKIKGWFPTSLLLRARNFFNDQTGYWIPACVAIGVSISCTISNVDSNSDFALVYVVTVAFNEPGSVVVFVFISDPHHCHYEISGENILLSWRS